MGLQAAGKMEAEDGQAQKDHSDCDCGQNFLDFVCLGIHRAPSSWNNFLNKYWIYAGILSVNGVTSYYRFGFADFYARV